MKKIYGFILMLVSMHCLAMEPAENPNNTAITKPYLERSVDEQGNKRSELVDLILFDTLAAKEYLKQRKEEFLLTQDAFLDSDNEEHHKMGLSESQPALLKLINACPLFRLEECESNKCFFNREPTACPRTQTEKLIVNDILQNLTKNNNEIICTSFGSGDFFQDKVILTKTLARVPNAKVTFHGIDKQYVFLPSDKHYSLEKMNEALLFLRNTFHIATIEILLHETVESYLEYLQINSKPHGDQIWGIDVIDARVPVEITTKDYDFLCQSTLNNKPQATNCIYYIESNGTNSRLCETSLARAIGFIGTKECRNRQESR